MEFIVDPSIHVSQHNIFISTDDFSTIRKTHSAMCFYIWMLIWASKNVAFDSSLSIMSFVTRGIIGNALESMGQPTKSVFIGLLWQFLNDIWKIRGHHCLMEQLSTFWTSRIGCFPCTLEGIILKCIMSYDLDSLSLYFTWMEFFKIYGM